jgi:hypothetical protein
MLLEKRERAGVSESVSGVLDGEVVAAVFALATDVA